MIAWRVQVIGVVVFVVALTGAAIAQVPADGSGSGSDATPAPAPAPAEQLFVEGRALLESSPAEACTKFEQSIALDPEAAGTLLNLGLCNERLGKTASALQWFRKAQFRAAETGMADYEAVAKNSTFMLAVRVPVLRITVKAPGSVFVDDKQVAAIDLGKIEVDPGVHVVELRGSTQPIRTEITVKDGDKRDVVLEPPPPPLAPPPPPPPRVLADIDRGAPRRRLAYITGAAGLAMWGGSIAVSLVARNRHDGSEHPEDWRSAQQLARFGGTGLFLLGTAAITGAVFLYMHAPGVERVERTAVTPRSRSLAATPVVGTDHLGAMVHGSF